MKHEIVLALCYLRSIVKLINLLFVEFASPLRNEMRLKEKTHEEVRYSERLLNFGSVLESFRIPDQTAGGVQKCRRY